MNRDTAVAIASLLEQIPGVDLVKEKQLADAQAKQRELLAQFRATVRS